MLEDRSAELNALLIKRYDVAFESPSHPGAVVRWLVALVTYDAYMALGFDPSSQQDAYIEKRAEDALAQAKEAADAQNGLYELPLRVTDPNGSGVVKGGPLFSSERSPYEGHRRDRERRRGVYGR